MKCSVSIIFVLAYNSYITPSSAEGLLPAQTKPTPCESDIYCHGPLLHTIQMARIFKDSKTFVDMKMRFSIDDTHSRFLTFMDDHDQAPDRDAVKGFLDETFEPAGQEFEPWIPNDWTKNPKILDQIKDPNYREWATTLNRVWKDLGRKMRDVVKTNSDMYSIIWVPNPVIVPGGRFREFYYWDSYWIVQGLLHSEMNNTVRGMLDNFAYIVENYGKIPNGGRIYYLNRSQPPLFLPMVKLYLDYTNDMDYLRKRISTYEKEFAYWLREHVRVIEVDGKKYSMAFYGHDGIGPRPESYSEDVDTAKHLKDPEQKDIFYSELKAAAESGWDFSSRWFIKESTDKGNLTNTHTRAIVPVDLNSILHWNARLLAEWHVQLGNDDKAKYYATIADTWLDAIEEVLWHEEVGVWLDYDASNNNRRDHFYPSNLAPLWTRSYRHKNSTSDDHRIRLVLKYLDNMNVIYPGGIPTSREHTGEQWDFPNAWPPLQHIVIVGLSQTNVPEAKRLALEIAQSWIQSNYRAFNDTLSMFEKYDATVSGGHGGGGEYEVQLGFGWTNGVVFDLLRRFETLQFDSDDKENTIDASVQQPFTDLAEESLVPERATSPEAFASGVMSAGSLITWLVAFLATGVACYIGLSVYRRRNNQGQEISARTPLVDSRGREGESGLKYTKLKNPKKRRVEPADAVYGVSD